MPAVNRSALKAGIGNEALAVCLKAYPDTNLEDTNFSGSEHRGNFQNRMRFVTKSEQSRRGRSKGAWQDEFGLRATEWRFAAPDAGEVCSEFVTRSTWPKNSARSNAQIL
jgi:hypothetical protein